MKNSNNSLIIFPGAYKTLQSVNPNVKLIAGYDKNQIILEIENQLDFTIIDLNLDGKIFYIALCGFKIKNKPQTAFSKGSNAVYLATCKNHLEPEKYLLLQFIPPNSKTSRHYHKNDAEVFHHIAGNSTIETSNNDLELSSNNSHMVGVEIFHQVITTNCSAINLLEVSSNKDDHYYE